MEKSLQTLMQGYQKFRQKYASGDDSIMRNLANHGQSPIAMVIACCDSRVDPAVILQCQPGDLFVVRNIANIVPPFEKDDAYHGTSAALEFGICFLKVKHLILLGHNHCGGIELLLKNTDAEPNDFISKWVSLIKISNAVEQNPALFARHALNHSYQNCLTFPWINEKLIKHSLIIHRWLFDIDEGQIYAFNKESQSYSILE